MLWILEKLVRVLGIDVSRNEAVPGRLGDGFGAFEEVRPGRRIFERIRARTVPASTGLEPAGIGSNVIRCRSSRFGPVVAAHDILRLQPSPLNPTRDHRQPVPRPLRHPCPGEALCTDSVHVSACGIHAHCGAKQARSCARAVPSSPLVRQSIIRMARGRRPFQWLIADPTVVNVLAGSSVKLDTEHRIERVPATVTLDRSPAPRTVIDRVLADLTVARSGAARVVVRWSGGSGAGPAHGAHPGDDRRGGLAPRGSARRPGRDALSCHLRDRLPCIDGLGAVAASDDATSLLVARIARQLLQKRE